MSFTQPLKRELVGLAAGGVVAGGTLIAQHYGLKRANLRRTDAYIAGTLALDAGYAAYLAITGKPLENLGAFFLVQVAGGATVKTVYRLDRKLGTGPQIASRDTGQLIEVLSDNEELRAQIADLSRQLEEAKGLDGLISTEDLLELAAHANTAKEDLSRVNASLEALLRKHEALQQRLRLSLVRRRAAKKKAGLAPASEQVS